MKGLGEFEKSISSHDAARALSSAVLPSQTISASVDGTEGSSGVVVKMVAHLVVKMVAHLMVKMVAHLMAKMRSRPYKPPRTRHRRAAHRTR